MGDRYQADWGRCQAEPPPPGWLLWALPRSPSADCSAHPRALGQSYNSPCTAGSGIVSRFPPCSRWGSVRSRQVSSTGQKRQCGLLGRPTAGESGGLDSGPSPLMHSHSDPAWSLHSVGLCFSICSMGTWQCFAGPLSFSAWPGRQVHPHVTKHAMTYMGDKPLTSRHCWISQSHWVPSHL